MATTFIDRPQYIHAIYALVGVSSGIGGKVDGPIEKIYFPDNVTPPSEDAIQAKLKEMQDEWDAQEYARQRKVEYPDLAEQLDYIYHNGITKWKSDMIKPVKDKYPK